MNQLPHQYLTVCKNLSQSSLQISSIYLSRNDALCLHGQQQQQQKKKGFERKVRQKQEQLIKAIIHYRNEVCF